MKRKGFNKIFAFTFRQHTSKKSYKTSIAIGVLLCLLIPAIVMACVEMFGNSTSSIIPSITDVFVVDKSSANRLDFNFLNNMGMDGYTEITYTDCGAEVNAALTSAQGKTKSLVVVIDEVDEGFAVSILLPEDTELKRRDANAFSDFMNSTFAYALAQKSGIPLSSAALLASPVPYEITVSGDSGSQMSDDIKNMLSMVIGYVLVMVIYFMVLLYGQGVANAVIMEKNSKLMELFLLSVDPGAMITGKVLATALAGAIQFTSWVVGLICGFVGGTLIVKMINPGTDMLLITIFESIDALSGMFSIGGIVVALLILLSGFLLYCSLASIGGALAGKPEDLSSTNLIFTMVLVISFFAIIFSGGLTGEIDSINPLFLWIPFTGVLTAPSQLILGALPVLTGIGVCAVTVVFSLVIMRISGKLYVALVHHRGNPPDISSAFKMLKKQ